MGFSETFEDENASDPLHLNEYKWDKICPQFLSCIPSDRTLFAQSDFIKANYFIMQVRKFYSFFYFNNIINNLFFISK